MVQSNHAFEELSLAGSSRVSTPETLFLRPDSKWDDPYKFSDCLDDRNMMAETIIHFDHFWLSTYAPLFLDEALGA
jgi:hypothetical protein